MCNIDELAARQRAVQRVRTLTKGLCDITDPHARDIVIADINAILNNLERVIKLKMLAGGEDGHYKS